MIYDRPQSLPAWAEDGSKTQPTDEEIQNGWPLSNLPPSRQRFNWVLNYVAQAVRYAMQTGIPEWDMDDDYPVNARVQHMGDTWVSLQPSSSIAPVEPGTDFDYWERWGYRASEGGGGGGGGSGTAEVRRVEFTATAGQTSFTIPGGYIVGSVQFVFVNGLSVGFTATNGGSVVLDMPASAGDLVEIYIFSVYVVEGSVRFGDPVLIDKGDLPFNADWNTYTTAGVYRITSGGGSGTNSPDQSPTQTGQLIVSTNGAAVTQLYFASDATGHFVRSKYSGTAWADWQQILTSENYQEFPAAVGVDSLVTLNYKDKSVTLAKIQDIPSGTFVGRKSTGSGVPEVLNSAEAAALLPDKIQPIAATPTAGALAITLNPTTLDFRSPTRSSGAVNTRRLITAASLTVPNGATLGAVNGQKTRLLVVAIDSAGTVELAVYNPAGSPVPDESEPISTTAISAAADNSNVFYSTTARTNVTYRVVGFIDSTQATAGVYATVPSLVQGAGGQALSQGKGNTFTQAQVFTSNGTFTVPPGVTSIRVTAIGGGGGGGSSRDDGLASGGNGGFGGCGFNVFSVNPGDTYPVTIGAGGTGANVAASSGTAGGTTSFGSLISATGGLGGPTQSNGAYPTAGTVTGGSNQKTSIFGSLGVQDANAGRIGIPISQIAPLLVGNGMRPRGVGLTAPATFVVGGPLHAGAPGTGETEGPVQDASGGTSGAVYVEF